MTSWRQRQERNSRIVNERAKSWKKLETVYLRRGEDEKKYHFVRGVIRAVKQTQLIIWGCAAF
jgi:hypothetical protein